MRKSWQVLPLVLLICGSAMGADAEDEPAPPEKTTLSSDVVEIPMDLGTGRPLVRVTINGRGPYDFTLDTGASQTVIDADLAAELGLPVVGESRIGSPSNPEAILSERVRAESLVLGGLELTGVTLNTFALRKMMGARHGGVLGFPDLADLLVTIDYPGRRVIVRRGELPADAPQVVEYKSEGCLISLPMTIGGKPLIAHLDSGNPGTFMLPMSLSDRWSFQSPPVEMGMAATVNGSSIIWSARIDGVVEVAGLTFENPEVALSDLLGEWANMGFDALQDVTLTVDQKNKRLRMIRTGTVAQREPARRRVGIMFQGMQGPADDLPVQDGALRVSLVAPGSIAEAAGVRVDDEILSINDRAVSDLVSGDLMELFGGHDPIEFEIRRSGGMIRISIE